MNETINGKTQELNVLLHAINDGVEEREMECIPVPDYVNGIINLTQDGKIIGTRPITEDDKQPCLLDEEKEIVAVFDILIHNQYCNKGFSVKFNDELFKKELLSQVPDLSDDPERTKIYTAKNSDERDIVVKILNDIIGAKFDQTTVKMRDVEKCKKSEPSKVTLMPEDIERCEELEHTCEDDSEVITDGTADLQENADLEDKFDAALTDAEKEEDEKAAKKAALVREKELKKSKKK